MDPKGHQQPPLSLGTPGRDLGARNILVTARTLGSCSVFCSHGGGTDRPGREGGRDTQTAEGVGHTANCHCHLPAASSMFLERGCEAFLRVMIKC